MVFKSLRGYSKLVNNTENSSVTIINFYCLICSKPAQISPSEEKKESSSTSDNELLSSDPKILKGQFANLCKCMEWEPPAKFQFNFNKDPFPFCEDCRSSVLILFKLNNELEEIQKKIEHVAGTLSSKIVESQGQERSSGDGRDEKDLKGQIPFKFEEKARYYRNEVCQRLSAQVKVRRREKKESSPKIRESSPPETRLRTRGQKRRSNSQSVPCPLKTNTKETQEISLPLVSESQRRITEDKTNDHNLKIQPAVTNIPEIPIVTLDDDAEPSESIPNYEQLLETIPDDDVHVDFRKTSEPAKVNNSANSFLLIDGRWTCIHCGAANSAHYNFKGPAHLMVCPGGPPEDAVETFTYWNCVFDKLQSEELQCRHCTQIFSSTVSMLTHLRNSYTDPEHRDTFRQLIGVHDRSIGGGQYLVNDTYPYIFSDDKLKCGSCPEAFVQKLDMLFHINYDHIQGLHFYSSQRELEEWSPEEGEAEPGEADMYLQPGTPTWEETNISSRAVENYSDLLDVQIKEDPEQQLTFE